MSDGTPLNDNLSGTPGDDTIHGNDGNDTIHGLGGRDELYGDAGNDSLVAGDGDGSVLDGGADNDTLVGGSEQNYLYGGAGDDDIHVHGTYTEVYGDTGFDRVFFDKAAGDYTIQRDIFDFWDITDKAGNMTVVEGVEQLIFADDTINMGNVPGKVIHGDDNGNLIMGSPANDTIYGEGGNDTIYGVYGTNYISGGAGNDALRGAEGNDTLDGGDGNDGLTGDGDSDYGWGNDVLIGGAGYNVMDGGYGDDSITGGDDGNRVETGFGNDTVITGNGDDIVFSRQGSDFISTGGGNDKIYDVTSDDNLWGLDTLDGGAGNDTIDGSGTIYGGTGDDSITVYANSSAIGGHQVLAFVQGGDGNDTINGMPAEYFPAQGATLDGGEGNDYIVATPGTDVLIGGAGDDTIVGGVGTADGGSGFDTFVVSGHQADYQLTYDAVHDQYTLTTVANGAKMVLSNVEKLVFSDGVQLLNARPVLSGHQAVLAGGYQDTGYVVSQAKLLTGFSDPDGNTLSVTHLSADHGQIVDNGDGTFTVLPDKAYTGTVTLSYQVSDGHGAYLDATETYGLTAVNHVFTGTKNVDHLTGTLGDDTLKGAAGDDLLIGNAGNDNLDGGVGNDTMYGGAGDDTYVVDSLLDVVSEQSKSLGIDDGGNDRVFSTVNYTLGAYIESLNLDGTANINGTGNELQNNIYGNAGNNVISGMDGNDKLKGMAGDDTLIGGTGNDWLEGGDGKDTFFFSAATINGKDAIQDFTHGTDVLLFAAWDYASNAGFTTGTAASGTGAQFIWDAVSHTLSYDHDGAGGDAAIAIATFQATAVVTASDIHFI